MKQINLSILILFASFGAASFSSGGTSSYFTDTEISQNNVITTGEWVMEPEPIDKDDCKKGGWEGLVDPRTGEIFKNQGQCVSYTNHVAHSSGPAPQSLSDVEDVPEIEMEEVEEITEE